MDKFVTMTFQTIGTWSLAPKCSFVLVWGDGQYHGDSKFKFVHGNRFLGQSKDKLFVYKVFVDLPGNGLILVKQIQVGGDMGDSWVIFNHVKQLKDWTTIVCHLYDNKYYIELTIAC
jgi:hypothetical protein